MTSRTENGTDQLSYSAARQRKITSSDSEYSSGVCPPDRRSWYDSALHSTAVPGCFAARSIIFCIAAPELDPGAASPAISNDGLAL